MTANQPTIEERLSRLETLFVNVGEKVAQHDGNIDVLVANIQQLTENVVAVSQRVDELSEQTTRNINRLAEEAAQDRQQAAIERQEFRNSINQILNYLRDRNGGSPPPQQ
ncbi:MAG: hypothetical protein KME64_34910 [Scytonematopsis contorta HA4267-MV1]|jgi:uncharacterized protein YoxC|nr:hypothetical protein [Scytonematopsis contorta HA4267-MV1]